MKTPTQDLFVNAYLAAARSGCTRNQCKRIALMASYPDCWQHLLLEETLDRKYRRCLHDLRSWQQLTLQLAKNHCPPHIVQGLADAVLHDGRSTR